MSSHHHVTPEEIAERLGFPSSSLASVKKGEVVTHELEASNEKDLSLLVVAVVDAGVDKLAEFIEAERVSEIQAATLSAGILDPADTLTGLGEMDLDEDTVKSLLKHPFLSKHETHDVKEGSKKHKGGEAYKKALAARATAYWEKGLDGIVPYEGKGRDPGSDLKSANDAALKVVKDPTIRGELQVVPANSEHADMHKLQWAIQKGNDQAAPTLAHLIRIKREHGFVNVTRKFYSGTDYDSSQILVGILPTTDGKCCVFYINRTFSSAVAGFGGSAKRSIGRKLMKSKLVETMKKAQAAAKNL